MLLVDCDFRAPVQHRFFGVTDEVGIAAVLAAGEPMEGAIRRTAVSQNIPYYLTVDGAQAAIGAIEALLKGEQQVRSLQEYHADA